MNPNKTFKTAVLLAGAAALLALGGVMQVFAKGYGETTEPSAKSPTDYPPDNTGRNVRDAKGGTLTPEDQAENKADLALTQRVRQAIIDDKTMSVSARNVKIISVDGKVTLRGPVETELEKITVVDKARRIAGLENVTDQLEVARP